MYLNSRSYTTAKSRGDEGEGINGISNPGPMEKREPEIITEKDQMRTWTRSMRAQGKTIGFVPTMGYLHQGHISLIKEARKHTDLLVVSIYVNPGQFSPTEDLSTYPSDFQGDVDKLMALPGGVDVVFHPKNLYDYRNNGSESGEIDTSIGAGCHNCNNNDAKEEGQEKAVVSCLEERQSGHETWVRVERLETGLCGKSRPIFFRGVATVVAKLFNIVEPDVAVFGKKDYQQWRIIRRMVSLFAGIYLLLVSWIVYRIKKIIIGNSISIYISDSWSTVPLLLF